MAERKKIEPQLPSGFRDYLPGEMAVRERMIDIIRTVFKSFGFMPIDTSIMEPEEVLTGGDAGFKKQIFTAGLRGEKQKLALRFDLTVPLARVVAAHRGELHQPFKRYEIGKTWRGERAQAGRYKEFLQCDADIVGTGSVAADAEIIALIYEAMCALGVERFLIRINTRKLLNGLPEYAGFPKSKIHDVLRTIDKLEKQGWDSVRKELASKEGGALGKTAIMKIGSFLDIKRSDGQLSEAKKLFAASPEALRGIEELEAIAGHLDALKVPRNVWQFDVSIARGLGYYTGAVFETVLTDAPEFGSIASGGRYDGLVANFSSVSIPAVGVSIGLDRLFAALQKMGTLRAGGRPSALVLNFDEHTLPACETLATELRRGGINTDLYLGNEKTLKGQLAYAAKLEYPLVLVLGTNELEKKAVQVKDMKRHTQENIPLKDAVGKCKELLSR